MTPLSPLRNSNTEAMTYSVLPYPLLPYRTYFLEVLPSCPPYCHILSAVFHACRLFFGLCLSGEFPASFRLRRQEPWAKAAVKN